jgi:hypothetical protein
MHSQIVTKPKLYQAAFYPGQVHAGTLGPRQRDMHQRAPHNRFVGFVVIWLALICASSNLPWMPSEARPAISLAMTSSTSATSPTITLTPSSGRPGTRVTITGTGFPPEEIVALYIDRPGPYLDVPGPRADSQGGFSKDINWPGRNFDNTGKVDPASPGAHSVCGDTAYPGSTQTSAGSACAPFVAEANALSSPIPSPGSTAKSGLQPSLLLLAAAILIVVMGGTVILARRGR